MRCYIYCTASSYNIKALYDFLKDRFESTTLYRDVIHVVIPNSDGSPADIFLFPYGSAVCWGLSESQERQFLNDVKGFCIQPLDEWELDRFTFSYGDAPKLNKDEIILPNNETLTKLAISHGLAQSVKLGTFENAIQKTFNSTKHIPLDLASRGKIPLSRSEIRRKMGDLFLERSSINLHFDVLDTPEFFWERPELEPLYMLIANYLEVATRVEVLNQRLDVVQELYQMLGTELNHQHSSRLEWAIICLIVIEVVLSFMRDVFKWL